MAVDCIDDPIALLDERPVAVSELWRKVLVSAAGEHADPLILVVPTWWPRGRCDVVSRAVSNAVANVVVMQRSSLHTRESQATVVELSQDVVVVTPPGSDSGVHPRDSANDSANDSARDDLATVAQLEGSSSVLLDVPDGVPPLSPVAIARLRSLGIPVTRSAGDRLRRSALESVDATSVHPQGRPTSVRPGGFRPGRAGCAVLAGTAMAIAAAGGGWATSAWSDDAFRPGAPSTMLTEGGIAVRVPTAWSVERVTSGSGSARVRVAAPGGSPALHITQSAAPAGSTLADAAESLRKAMDAEPGGVFVDFEAAARRGDRPAVAYVEQRADSRTLWAVFLDGAVRIAVGCQSSTADAIAVADVCADAVRSAHAVR